MWTLLQRKGASAVSADNAAKAFLSCARPKGLGRNLRLNGATGGAIPETDLEERLRRGRNGRARNEQPCQRKCFDQRRHRLNCKFSKTKRAVKACALCSLTTPNPV